MIASYTRESGVRLLEREITPRAGKRLIKSWPARRKRSALIQACGGDFLGVRKYRPEHIAGKDEIGLVKGLAWTSQGGETLDVEVNVLEGAVSLSLLETSAIS